MARSDNLLKWIDIYAHGSTGLGTTVKPIGAKISTSISSAAAFTADRPPAELKRIVGDRLKENARYAAMLEEKKRCWRLNYAREYHLDIRRRSTMPNAPTAANCSRQEAAGIQNRRIRKGCSKALFERGQP